MTAAVTPSSARVDREVLEQAEWAVRRTCLLLDEERFDEWLECFSDDATYGVVAHSEELRREMRWLDLSRTELDARLANVDSFVRDRARRTRVPTVMAVEPHDDGSVEVMSYVVAYRTELDGSSSLYALLRYDDLWHIDEWKLAARRVVLRTRMLATGSHMPL